MRLDRILFLRKSKKCYFINDDVGYSQIELSPKTFETYLWNLFQFDTLPRDMIDEGFKWNRFLISKDTFTFTKPHSVFYSFFGGFISSCILIVDLHYLILVNQMVAVESRTGYYPWVE